jgi:O-antigen/teichoic acid export membrane protein
MLGDGLAMVRLGIAFTLAGIAGSGADFLIRSYLNNVADLEVVGLYNVGYLLTMTYAGMVFSALETDYFPRLSAVQHDVMATNQTVNRQMEVSLLLLSPMLAALIVALPVLIPLLFSSRFLPVVAMTQVAALAMYLKVLTLPVAYITLARGRSVAFLMLEVSYYVVLVALVVVCFERWGLLGAGVALLLAHLFDYVIINGFAYKKYGYRCSVTVFRYAFVQLSLGVFAYVLTLVASGTVYWLLGAVVTSLSAVFSLQVLRSKAHLWETLTRRFQRQNRKSSSTSTRL